MCEETHLSRASVYIEYNDVRNMETIEQESLSNVYGLTSMSLLCL